MAVMSLAWHSLLNRKVTACLTVLAIGLSVTLLLGVEKIRHEAKRGFISTISGTDLIVGARTGPVQLLLYSVFRIGDATNNIAWENYQHFANHKMVKWSIPFALGDSHKGYRVLGTNQAYFEHYRHGNKQRLKLAQGKRFTDLYDAVIGAEVAKKLGYQLGDKVVLAHGAGKASFVKHDNQPFQITGILAPTGTPVDQTIHVSLEAIEAIHLGWERGTPSALAKSITPDQARQLDLQPKTITAFLLGLKSKIGTFVLQREVNKFEQEPLLAIIPGVAITQLWQLIGTAEKALLVISGFVVVTGLIGMLTTILTSLSERRREMAILRSVGARPFHIFSLMISEAGLIAILGCLTGIGFLYGLMAIARPIFMELYGIHIQISFLTQHEIMLLSIVIISGFFMGIFPAWRAYKNSLTDGMTIRT
ncbi:ABC transporter permease [Endozoicomonas sp. SM1973]|uniref:ABC transporter permease n=1 Tax=Spartinivicinus marinus TaxID=2994442 RepID=A0A853IDA2_9GAMM|nr:ABC transporter permease [Spartinivicinus marinus]MCX4028704.1 ABC transporter permease [Spartinivicinus marinus]NYZ68034.1 ABC transporter permease [Spartinivicinus marinus]